MKLVLDASAWFAYFAGSREGEVVRDYLSKADEVVTPASVVAEVAERAKARGDNPAEFVQFLESRSLVQPLTVEIAARAARLLAAHRGRKFDTQEAFVVATANELGARTLSLNPSLEGLEDIVPLG